MKIALLFSPDYELSEPYFSQLKDFFSQYVSYLGKKNFSLTIFSNFSFPLLTKEPFISFNRYFPEQFSIILRDFDVIHNFENKQIALLSLFLEGKMNKIINSLSVLPCSLDLLKMFPSNYFYFPLNDFSQEFKTFFRQDFPPSFFPEGETNDQFEELNSAILEKYLAFYAQIFSLQKQKSKKKLKIVFYANTPNFDGNTPFTRGLGGTESAVVYISRQLALLGHEVTVFSHENEKIIIDGVSYLNKNNFDLYCQENLIDILITLRIFFRTKIEQAKVTIFWTEDDFDQQVLKKTFSDSFNAEFLDRIFVVSNYQKNSIQKEFLIPVEKFYLTRNGINPDFFTFFSERKKNKLIFTSAPHKGLAALAVIFPLLREIIPDVEIDIYSSLGIYDLEKMDFLFREDFVKIEKIPGMNLKKTLSQPELAKKLQEASLLFFPNTFPETSCISALEAQAAGLPVVTSALGALTETVLDGQTGICIPGDPFSSQYQQNFILATKEILENPKKWEFLSKNASERLKNEFNWSKISQEWENELSSYLDEYYLARKFFRFMKSELALIRQNVTDFSLFFNTFILFRKNFSFVRLKYSLEKELLNLILKDPFHLEKRKELLLILSDLYYLLGDKNSSQSFNELFFKDYQDNYPKNYLLICALIRHSEFLLAEKKYSAVISFCQYGINNFTDHFYFRLLLAETLSQLKNYRPALKIYHSLLKDFPPAFYLPEMSKGILLKKIIVALADLALLVGEIELHQQFKKISLDLGDNH